MARPASSRPTDAELAILRLLWEKGPSTVREVFDALRAQRDVGYTTVLKIMQIMYEKKLVLRDDSRRTHVYRARAGQQQTERKIVSDLIDRLFGGSARALVMQALSARPAAAEELAEIRRAIEQAETKRPHN